jgi:hypothetical protein
MSKLAALLASLEWHATLEGERPTAPPAESRPHATQCDSCDISVPDALASCSGPNETLDRSHEVQVEAPREGATGAEIENLTDTHATPASNAIFSQGGHPAPEKSHESQESHGVSPKSENRPFLAVRPFKTPGLAMRLVRLMRLFGGNPYVPR